MKSQWVRAEADLAREAGKLVQLRIDGALLPLPFNQIQCADLTDWSGDADAPGWRKVTASIAELFRGKSQLAAVLEQAATSPPQAPAKPSLAVLPFANLSGEADQEYFADGMVVEIVAALSRIKSIFVIASGSSLTFKNKGLTPQDVARQLGVRYILEGRGVRSVDGDLPSITCRRRRQAAYSCRRLPMLQAGRRASGNSTPHSHPSDWAHHRRLALTRTAL